MSLMKWYKILLGEYGRQYNRFEISPLHLNFFMFIYIYFNSSKIKVNKVARGMRIYKLINVINIYNLSLRKVIFHIY